MSGVNGEVKEPAYDYAALGRQVRKAVLDARSDEEHLNRLRTVLARHITNRTYTVGSNSIIVIARKEEFHPYDMSHLVLPSGYSFPPDNYHKRMTSVTNSFGAQAVVLSKNDEHTYTILMSTKME